MPYVLPIFISRTLAEQPLPPRRVPMLAVVRAVLTGADCAIYAVGCVVLVAFGVSAAVHLWPSASRSSDIPTGLVIMVLGLLSGLLAVFRIWHVDRVLRFGDAQLAQVTEAEVGRARIYGTPWGEPMLTRGWQPIAARGNYRLATTSDSGRYYMQQWWAAELKPGARIWVLRWKGRDVLYAPANYSA